MLGLLPYHSVELRLSIIINLQSQTTYPHVDTSKLNTYSDVFALNEDTLRTPLSIDDQAVQIWAAWALGIKINDASCPSEVRTLLDAEPTPGVRQNLLVFLAGSGDFDLLETYARTDPNADVRAAACNLIARVAVNTQEKNILLEELLISDKSSDVRNTILRITLRDIRLISLESLRHVILNEEANLQIKALEIVSLQRNSFGCVFQRKVATDSTRKLPPVPREGCHPFQSKAATLDLGF